VRRRRDGVSEQRVIDRDGARRLGLTYYFTGKPCKHGHLAERFVSFGGCVECNRIHHSGVIPVFLPRELHARLRLRADREGTSVPFLVIRILKDTLGPPEDR